jgi:hypothetical protein
MVAVQLVSGVMAGGGLSLSPVVDLGDIYQRSWAVIDFFLLFALFTGIARATVGHRLEGRAGQMVSLALGGILALSGVGLELSMGFNLTSLGPVAALVFLLLVGVAVFLLLKQIGLSATTAAAVAVIAIGLGASSVSGNAGQVIGGFVALLQFCVVGAVGFLIYRATLSPPV